MTKPNGKHPGGRPSLYSQAYCNEVIALMGDGYSLAACAGALGVSRDTIYEWKAQHPEFSDSVGIGEAKRQYWWESKGRQSAADGTGNAGMIQFGLKNVAAQDFREKVEVATTQTVAHTLAGLEHLEPEKIALLTSILEEAATIETAKQSKPNGKVH